MVGSNLRGGGTFLPGFLGIVAGASRRSSGCFGELTIVLRSYARLPEAKFLGEDAFQRFSPLGQYVPPSDILTELKDVGKA